ncbi:MAG: zinc-binding alcohol dehydrogenase [Methylacidiphilales bacterium]|nr:zinc-binding alcohol dehydrogenase [Candidatus Methylacidiphilales bacterium]
MPNRLVCSKPNTIAWEKYDLPAKLEPHQIRVRNTHGAEKHGTMNSFIHGHGNKRGRWDGEKQMFVPEGLVIQYPFSLGNMQVGVVEETGKDARRWRVGDRVLYYGAFAPAAVMGENNPWKLDANTSWKAATCLDPAAYALCALRDGEIRLGDSVVIFSLGAIGLMAVQLARLAGCHPIIAVDPIAHRREVALKTGADLAIDPIGADVGARLREATGGRGVDRVIEYSGAMEALQASLRGVAFGGTIVLGGFPGPMKAGLDLGAEAHMNRPNIVFSRTESDPNREHPRWDNGRIRSAVYTLIMKDRIDAERVVFPVVKFNDNLPTAYDTFSTQPDKSVKLGVEY